MGGGGLVVAEQSSTEWYTAMGPVESFAQTAQAIGNGDWVEAGLNGVAGGLETLGAIADPAGALLSAGVGWLLEHVEPLPTFLDELAGNPDEIHAFASTWHNVADRIHDNADDFRQSVHKAAAEWEGPAIEAYKGAAEIQATIIDGFGTMTTGVALCTEVAGAIVAGVRALVRDAISQLVGYGLSKLAQLLSPLAPKAIAEIVGKAMEWVSKISTFIKSLISSMGKLGTHLSDLMGKLGDAGTKIREIATKFDAMPINANDYHFDDILRGSATRTSFPSNPAILYGGGSEAVKNGASADDR